MYCEKNLQVTRMYRLTEIAISSYQQGLENRSVNSRQNNAKQQDSEGTRAIRQYSMCCIRWLQYRMQGFNFWAQFFVIQRFREHKTNQFMEVWLMNCNIPYTDLDSCKKKFLYFSLSKFFNKLLYLIDHHFSFFFFFSPFLH